MKYQLTSKTLEFRFPDRIPERWLNILTRVWNDGLFYLKWYEHQQRIAKCQELGIEIDPAIRIQLKKDGDDKKWTFYQPIERKRRIDKTKSWDKDNLEIVPIDFEIKPDDPIPAPEEKRAKPDYVNPVWLEPCEIKFDNAIELRKPFAKKRCDWLAESDIPMVYVNDFLELVLIAAWDAYKKGKRKCPRYKNKDRERVSTIPSASFRNQCRWLGGDELKLPGFDRVRIAGIDKLLFDPLTELSEEMEQHPDRYPQLQQKIDAVFIKERSVLIKENGFSLSKLRKELEPERLDEFLKKYENYLDLEECKSKAVEYYSLPGSFRLIQRNGYNYIQISGFFSTKSTETNKTVAIDTGVKLLIQGTNGLNVKHTDFTKYERRLSNLDRRISKCVHGSSAWQKLMKKKRAIELTVAKSKKTRQTYYAAQIADVNQHIIFKNIEIPPTVGLPLPIFDKSQGYLPNGATRRSAINRVIYDKSLGQFRLLLEQQSAKHGRQLEVIKVDPKTTSGEMLDSVRARSNRKISPSNSESQNETVERKLKEGGKRKRLPKSQNIPETKTPEPIKFNKRDRTRERNIG